MGGWCWLPQCENGGVKCQMCRTARRRRRRREIGSVEVRTRKQQGRVDEWREDEREEFQLKQCELELSNKSGKISWAENNSPFLMTQRCSVDWAWTSSITKGKWQLWPWWYNLQHTKQEQPDPPQSPAVPGGTVPVNDHIHFLWVLLFSYKLHPEEASLPLSL